MIYVEQDFDANHQWSTAENRLFQSMLQNPTSGAGASHLTVPRTAALSGGASLDKSLLSALFGAGQLNDNGSTSMTSSHPLIVKPKSKLPVALWMVENFANDGLAAFVSGTDCSVRTKVSGAAPMSRSVVRSARQIRDRWQLSNSSKLKCDDLPVANVDNHPVWLPYLIQPLDANSKFSAVPTGVLPVDNQQTEAERKRSVVKSTFASVCELVSKHEMTTTGASDIWQPYSINNGMEFDLNHKAVESDGIKPSEDNRSSATPASSQMFSPLMFANSLAGMGNK